MPLVAFINDCPTLGTRAPVPLGTVWCVCTEHLAKCIDAGTDPLEGMRHSGLTVAEWIEGGKEPDPWPEKGG